MKNARRMCEWMRWSHRRKNEGLVQKKWRIEQLDCRGKDENYLRNRKKTRELNASERTEKATCNRHEKHTRDTSGRRTKNHTRKRIVKCTGIVTGSPTGTHGEMRWLRLHFKLGLGLGWGPRELSRGHLENPIYRENHDQGDEHARKSHGRVKAGVLGLGDETSLPTGKMLCQFGVYSQSRFGIVQTLY